MSKVDSAYGRMMARKRFADKAKNKRGTTTSPKDRKNATKPFQFRLYPMKNHDGSIMPRPIRWGANGDISDELVKRIRRHFTILKAGTGLGKTALGLETVGKRQLELGRQIPLIVIAPAPVIQKKGWHRTIATWNKDNPDNPIDPLMIESPARLRMMMGDDSARREVYKLLGKDGMILVDEVHNFKSPTSAQTKALGKLRQYTMLGLSATPMTNDPIMDTISYLILARYYNSKNNFIQTHEMENLIDKMTGQLLIYDKGGRLVTSTWQKGYDTMLSQASKVIYAPNIDMSTITLPNVHTTCIQLPHDEELAMKFRSMAKAWREGAFESATDLRLAQIETIQRDPNRLDMLMEILKLERTVRPIVFYWNVPALEAIVERLEAEGMDYQIVSGKHRAEDADFDLDIPLLVQYQAGSEGIEMPTSNTTIFYQNGNSYSRLQQARGRNVRRGSDHQVYHYHLVADNIFDQSVFDAVNNMEELNDEYLDAIAVATAEEG